MEKEKSLIADLTLKGGPKNRNAFGIIQNDFKKKFSGLVNNGIVCAEINEVEKCVDIYAVNNPLPEETLIKFAESYRPFKKKDASIKVTYYGFSDKPAQNNKNSVYTQGLQERISALESERNTLKIENEDLLKQAKEISGQKTYIQEIEDKNLGLEQTKEELELKVQDLETKTSKDFSGLIRSDLIAYSKKIQKLEEYLEQEGYTKELGASAQEIFEQIHNVLELNLTSINAVLEFTEEVKLRNSEITLENLYDKNHKEYLDGLEKAYVDLKKEGETVKTLTITRESAENVLKERKEELNKKKADYNDERQEFVKNIKDKLPELAQKLKACERHKNLHAKVKEFGCENIPVYLEFTEDKQNYNLNIHLPQREKSILCSSIYHTRLLGNKQGITDKAKKAFNLLGIEKETNSNLMFYTVDLSKKEFSFKDILALNEFLLNPNDKNWTNTSYGEMGINPSITSNFSCNYSAEDITSDEKVLASFREGNSRELVRAILNSIPENGIINAKDLRTQIKEKVKTAKPNDISQKLVKLKSLGIIDSKGKTTNVIYSKI